MFGIVDFRALTSRFQQNICSGNIYRALGWEIRGVAVVVCYVGGWVDRDLFGLQPVTDRGMRETLPPRALRGSAGLENELSSPVANWCPSPATKSRVGRSSGGNVPPLHADPDTLFVV